MTRIDSSAQLYIEFFSLKNRLSIQLNIENLQRDVHVDRETH